MQKNTVVAKLLQSSILVILFTLFFSSPSQAPITHAQTCSVPTQVSNVAITFPSCVGNSCNFTQGSCSWAAVTGATGYQVTITEVETSRTVQSQQVASSVTTNTFPVTESNTYRCDVVASNSCGSGPTGTASLLCKVDAAVTTTPAPTATPLPTATPAPRMLVTGTNTPMLVIVGSSALAMIVGIALFVI